MPIVKTTEGKYYRVDDEQEVTEQEAQTEVARLQAELASLESAVGNPAAVAAPAEPVAPAATQEAAAPADPPQVPDSTEASQLAAPAVPEAAAPDAGQSDPNSVTLQ